MLPAKPLRERMRPRGEQSEVESLIPSQMTASMNIVANARKSQCYCLSNTYMLKFIYCFK